MTTYIALLRGINVSGYNKIKMIELRQLFLELGFIDVLTYIQSGNVIFKSEEIDTVIIENNIISAIKTNFGHDIKVIVITKKYLDTIFNSNPYIDRANIDITKLCVTFLSNKPALENVSQIEKLISNSEDEFKIMKKSIYLHCPSSFAKTKLTNNLIERKLKTSATSRNWKTITKLVELCN